MHTSFMQLRYLVLAVLLRAGELSVSHRALGDQVPGEASQGVTPQRKDMCMYALRG